MNDLELADADLAAAAAALGNAATWMVTGNAPRPTGGFESLRGIDREVDLYLRGVAVARAALADAAKGGSETLASLMEDSTRLDRLLTAALYSGYAVRGAGR